MTALKHKPHISQYAFFTLLETFSSQIPTEEEKVSSTAIALGTAFSKH